MKRNGTNDLQLVIVEDPVRLVLNSSRINLQSWCNFADSDKRKAASNEALLFPLSVYPLAGSINIAHPNSIRLVSSILAETTEPSSTVGKRKMQAK
jgi:hypothetical protein